jgi:hypothetical protein
MKGDYKMSIHTMEDFVRKFNEDTVFVDHSWNRKDTCWSIGDERSYIESVSRNWVHGQPINLVNIKESLRYCQEKQPQDEQSIEYYQDLLNRGYEYIAIDGQHRTKVLHRFINNEFQFNGDFYDAQQNCHKISNKLYREFPNDLKSYINGTQLISVHIYEKIGKRELGWMFIRKNTSRALNKQELRHALATPIGAWIWGVGRKHEKSGVTKLFVKPADISRQLDDEFFLKMLLALNVNISSVTPSFYDLKSSTLDSFYELGVGGPANIHKSAYASIIGRSGDILNLTMKVVKKQDIYKASARSRIPSKTMWAVLFACEYVYDHGLQIQDEAKFFSKILEIDQTLCDKSQTSYGKALELYNQKLASYSPGGSNPEPVKPKAYNYYHRCAELPHQPVNRIRRKDELIKSIKRQHKTLGLTKPTAAAA